MPDELVTALLGRPQLRVVVATTAELSREARELQHAQAASAALLAQGLTAAVLVAALQKGKARINLQLECDGPLRGFFADAAASGEVRGYVKNAAVAVENAGEFRWRPALGNSGFLSVLRDLGRGEYYRSSVELTAFDLQADLEHYFALSEQLEAAVSLSTCREGSEALAGVAGVLIQPLPEGDRDELARLREALSTKRPLDAALRARPGGSAANLLKQLFPRDDVEVMAQVPLQFRCDCSLERVLKALVVLGAAELSDMIQTEGHAEVRCEFCSRRYEVSRAELETLRDGLTA
ncbi:MAG: Hsp33 family molecular chaperone HslO [Myxococcaceae bacterium]